MMDSARSESDPKVVMIAGTDDMNIPLQKDTLHGVLRPPLRRNKATSPEF